jgi:hypothetical protein
MGAREFTLAAFDVSTFERSIIGSFTYPSKEFRETAEWVARRPDGLAAPRRRPGRADGAPEAFARLASGDLDASKIMVFPSGLPGRGKGMSDSAYPHVPRLRWSAVAARTTTTRRPGTGSTTISPRRWPSTRSTAQPAVVRDQRARHAGSSRSRTEDGTTGFAVTTGGELGAWIIEKHLARFVEGQLVTDVEKIWDQMYLATPVLRAQGHRPQHHQWGRPGAVGPARARSAGARVPPAGGAVRDELVFYATGARPDLAKDMGFVGGKMPLQHGRPSARRASTRTSRSCA